MSLMCLPVSSRCTEPPKLPGSGLCGEDMSVLLTQASSKALGRSSVPLKLSICKMHTQENIVVRETGTNLLYAATAQKYYFVKCRL